MSGDEAHSGARASRPHKSSRSLVHFLHAARPATSPGLCYGRAHAVPALPDGSYEGETGVSYKPRRLAPTGSTAGWIVYLAISPIPSPPPVRLRAEPLSHRLPLKGGVILQASTRLPVELYHSPLEGESQKPSRMAKADAEGGKARLRTVRQGCSRGEGRSRQVEERLLPVREGFPAVPRRRHR